MKNKIIEFGGANHETSSRRMARALGFPENHFLEENEAGEKKTVEAADEIPAPLPDTDREESGGT
jgi:hypothetical protein